MDTSVLVEAIAAPTAVIVAALSYLFTKMKEREADWRKWKYEQYKEFVTALGAVVQKNAPLEDQKNYTQACNTLNLIGAQNVLSALRVFIESLNSDKSREEQNILLSKLIWEISKDAKIPGTPKGDEFSARLWYPGK